MADADTVQEKSTALIKTEDGESVGSELTLDALPSTVLIQLCPYLVEVGKANEYDALDAFRKTCSATASAVNSYLQKASNLPEFPALIEDNGRTTYLTANFLKSELLLHPIRYVGGFIGRDPRKCGLKGKPAIWTIRRKLKTRESIETAAQMMLGQNIGLDRFKIRCGRNSDFSRVALLLSQFSTIHKMHIKIKQLNDETAANILEVVRGHEVKNLFLKFHSWNLSDPHRFILAISSLVDTFYLECIRPPCPSMLNIDLDWWKTYLIDQIGSGKVLRFYNDYSVNLFDATEGYVSSVTGLRGIAWWKQT